MLLSNFHFHECTSYAFRCEDRGLRRARFNVNFGNRHKKTLYLDDQLFGKVLYCCCCVLITGFFCFKFIIIHYHAQKQRNSNSIKPRINLNHNMQLNCGISSNKAEEPQIKI